jgi:hypothetical protein
MAIHIAMTTQPARRVCSCEAFTERWSFQHRLDPMRFAQLRRSSRRTVRPVRRA